MKTHHYLKLGLLWLALCSFRHSHATDYVWVGTTNVWTVGTNWSPVAPTGGPTQNDNVTINAVVAPKLAPNISTTGYQVNSLKINSGGLNLSGNIVFTVIESLTITGPAARITGAGRLAVGTSTTRATLVTIGDDVVGIAIGALFSAWCNRLVLRNARLGSITVETDELAITDCTFTGAVTVKKTGGTTDALNGVISFGSSVSFTNSGTGSLLFGNSDLDNISFGSTTGFSNTGTGSILFGNTDNDLFAFRNDVTFTRASTGTIEVARYGNSDFYYDLNYNITGSPGDIIFGNVGGGTISFVGPSTQRIQSATASPFKVNKFNVNKGLAGGLGINIPLTLVPMPGATSPNPQLTLISGYVSTGNGKLTVPDNTEVVLGPDPSKSYINGAMTKVGSSAFTFPIGKGGFYRPITISAPIPTASCTFTAEYDYDEPPNGSLDPDIVSIGYCQSWILTRTEGTSDVFATLSWNGPGCEVIQPVGLKFCRFNSTTKRWESIAATQDNAAQTLTTNSVLPGYGYFAFGNSTKKIFLDTRSLDATKFTVTGAQLPEGTEYTSGGVGLGKTIIPLLPIPPATGTSTILISILPGDENEAMKITFDIDNATDISNVKVSIDNSSTFVPLVSDFYTIDNTPVNGKRLVFLKGDESNVPLFGTNLTDGMVMTNSTGMNFQITGLASYTASLKILSLDNTEVKQLTVYPYTWDGTDVNGQEVPNGVYKFELTITNTGSDYVYNGQIIVK